MAIRGNRRLPPRDMAWFDPATGKPTEDFYNWCVNVERAFGGIGVYRVVQSPVFGGSPVPGPPLGAVGTLPLTVDGVEYQVLYG